MRRAFSFLIGLLSGAMVGAAVAILLAPTSGQELQKRVRTRVENLIEEGQRAAAARRVELETQLEAFKRGTPVTIEPASKHPRA